MSNAVYYLLCGALTVGILIGIAMMGRVQTALKGNALSALCTVLAIVLTLARCQLFSDFALLICVALSTALGLLVAMRVKLIEMPQLVALLNGFGGAASAIVAAMTFRSDVNLDLFVRYTAALALVVGMFTLTGSLIAAGKLHKLLSQKPVIWPQHQTVLLVSMGLTLAATVAIPFVGGAALQLLVLASLLLSGFLGVAFAIRVGGADMPITISLLNSLSGVAGAIAGMAVSDPLLVAVGGVVGASGLFLTQTMCQAMNRSLPDILLGKASLAAPADPAAAPTVKQAEKAPAKPAQKEPTDLDALFNTAKRVIIIPGYGMALAQAQPLVKELADKLEANQAEVLFAIHPVAGRMPGHMNVLLCEVDIPYEKLYEMDDINPLFPECDIALVIGANDVVNPAANTAEGSPIYGLPILHANQARHVVICNYDLQPGYAGVENVLYTADNVTLMLGDAKESLTALIGHIKSA